MKKGLIKVKILCLITILVSIVGSASLRVVLLVNGYLGDLSFFDSAAAGMKIIEEELGAQTRIVEVGTDPSKWEPALADLSEMKWDLIIVGSTLMTEVLEDIAPQYPNQKYIFFDGTVDYSKGNLGNVYSILFKQNEGSFLAGALAAMVTNSYLPLANPNDNYIGFLGGMDIPVINDFLIGYIQGAKYVDPQIKVAISYVGDFYDAAKGKEMSLAQFYQGVDVGMNAAGGAGIGQVEAAYEAKRYVIGVDSDQTLLFEPKKAEHILTSMLKRVDNSLIRAVKLYQEGNLQFGRAESLGLKEEGVGLAENEYYYKLVPETMRNELEIIKNKIINEEIVVESALGMSKAQLDEIRNSVKK